jgi:hypothetical protein
LLLSCFSVLDRYSIYEIIRATLMSQGKPKN